jgi:hypothetical protein
MKEQPIAPLETCPVFEDEHAMLEHLLPRAVKVCEELSPFLLRAEAPSNPLILKTI